MRPMTFWKVRAQWRGLHPSSSSQGVPLPPPPTDDYRLRYLPTLVVSVLREGQIAGKGNGKGLGPVSGPGKGLREADLTGRPGG